MGIDLSNIRTEDLRAEIQRRENYEHVVGEHIPHIGIIDSEGLDAITAVPDAKEFADVIRKMELRTRFNAHRRPEIFFVKIPKYLADEAMKKPEKGADVIRGLSNYQKIY